MFYGLIPDILFNVMVLKVYGIINLSESYYLLTYVIVALSLLVLGLQPPTITRPPSPQPIGQADKWIWNFDYRHLFCNIAAKSCFASCNRCGNRITQRKPLSNPKSLTTFLHAQARIWEIPSSLWQCLRPQGHQGRPSDIFIMGISEHKSSPNIATSLQPHNASWKLILEGLHHRSHNHDYSIPQPISQADKCITSPGPLFPPSTYK